MYESSTRDQGIGRWFARRAEFSPDHTALVFGDRSWTYAAFQRHIDALAAALAEGGVRRGDRVGHLGLNHPDYLLTLYAAARLGAIFVPLNHRLTGPELRFLIRDAGIHTLLHAAAFDGVLAGIRDDLPCRRYLRAPGDEHGELVTEAAGATGAEPEHHVGAEDVALIMYTSGTSGRPKGAMITHANLLASIHGLGLAFETRADDRTLVVAPLFHIGGLNVTTLSALLAGATAVLEHSFDAGRVLRLIGEREITTMFAVPTMLVEMARHPSFAAARLGSLRLVVSGGAPVPAALQARYLERGVRVCAGYGMTEATPLITITPPERAADKAGTVGLPSFFSEVRLVGADGRDAAPGEPGEFLVRGPNVMKGYWNRPEATAETLAGGWLHTGDIGVRDEDGFYRVVGRVKDMIITGGENVYPAEVEAVLAELPDVADAAVFGVPDDTWGERVVAVVRPADGREPSREEILAALGARLARYKLPRRIEFTPDIPRSPSGKVVKSELRDRYASPRSTS